MRKFCQNFCEQDRVCITFRVKIGLNPRNPRQQIIAEQGRDDGPEVSRCIFV